MRRVFLGIILQFSVQMTGVSVIQYYAPEVFAAIGFTYEKTFLFQTINSVIALIAQALCILTVDRVSRSLTTETKQTSHRSFRFSVRPKATFDCMQHHVCRNFCCCDVSDVSRTERPLRLTPPFPSALQAKYPAEVKNTSAGYAFVIMTWIYNFFFSYGIGPLSWAYPVEIMNTATRAKGTALTSMSCWIANFFIVSSRQVSQVSVSRS